MLLKSLPFFNKPKGAYCSLNFSILSLLRVTINIFALACKGEALDQARIYCIIPIIKKCKNFFVDTLFIRLFLIQNLKIKEIKMYAYPCLMPDAPTYKKGCEGFILKKQKVLNTYQF